MTAQPGASIGLQSQQRARKNRVIGHTLDRPEYGVLPLNRLGGSALEGTLACTAACSREFSRHAKRVDALLHVDLMSKFEATSA